MELIGIRELNQVKNLINIKNLCKLSGIDYSKIYTKMVRDSQLNLDDSRKITAIFEEHGIVIRARKSVENN